MKNIILILALACIVAACSKSKPDSPITHKTSISIKSGAGTTENPDTVFVNTPLLCYAMVDYGNPISFIWDFGNGDTLHGQTVIYQYTLPGEYTITLETYDGTSHSSSSLGIVVIEDPIYRLSSASDPDAQGKITYTLKFRRSAVPPTDTYWYSGSNPESNWQKVVIDQIDEKYAYYQIKTYDAVYTQAFGGINETDTIWADLTTSQYYDPVSQLLRTGLIDQQLVTEPVFNETWPIIPGQTGDPGPNAAIRVSVSPTHVELFVNAKMLAESASYSINWPQVQYKTNDTAEWSNYQTMTWVGGTGWAGYSLPRSVGNSYFFRFFSDQDNPEATMLDVSSSILYNFENNCIYFELVSP